MPRYVNALPALPFRAGRARDVVGWRAIRVHFQRIENITPVNRLLPLDGVGSAVPPLQLHPVFSAVSSRVPSGNAMSRLIGFGDKSLDNLKYFFQTQGFEFSFLSQRARRDAFASSILPKTPVLKLNRPFARKPPATIASELTRAAFMLVEKPQVAALRPPRVK